MANYNKYSDIVTFDLTYGLLRNVAHDLRRYRVGIFGLQDSNLRALLGGIVFMVDETTEAMYQAFNLLFDIHGKAPTTLITDDQTSIASAVT